MGYYDQRDDDGEYWVIPSQVDYRHGIKCPFCSKWNNITSDAESHESHKDNHWSCQHCNRPYQIYICSNCDEIAALPGKKGKGRRNCRCCRTKNLTTDWCFDDYSYSDDEESSDEEDDDGDEEWYRGVIPWYDDIGFDSIYKTDDGLYRKEHESDNFCTFWHYATDNYYKYTEPGFSTCDKGHYEFLFYLEHDENGDPVWRDD